MNEEIKREDLHKFLTLIYQDNENFKDKLAWMPDGTVLETVGSRFFWLFKGSICKVINENEKLKKQNKRLSDLLKDIDICISEARRIKGGDI